MTGSTAANGSGADAGTARLAATALARLQAAGHTRIDPPILQPADTFLDLVGEDIRRRLFLTNGADGPELCLRPDFTIPVCRQHLESEPANRRDDYCYAGPVFRQRPGGIGEIPQVGAESLGRSDREQADAAMLALATGVLADLGISDPVIRIGDETLFTAVLAGLNLPVVWQRRLRGLFGETARLDAAIARMGGEGVQDDSATRLGFLAALDGANHEAAQQVVTDLLSIAGITAVAGRSASEIAERFLEQAALANGSGANAGAAATLRDYLAIKGQPDVALGELKAFASRHGLDLSGPLAAFEARLAAINAHGLAAPRMQFAADFGRRLDYYTGFVFEMTAAGHDLPGQIVGGGRYDKLLRLLGAPHEVPAVGFSLWLDRLQTVVEARA